MEKISKIKSIGTKILGIVFFSIFLITATLGSLSFNFSKTRLVSMLGESIKGIAATTANFIKIDDVLFIINSTERLRQKYFQGEGKIFSYNYEQMLIAQVKNEDKPLLEGIPVYHKYTEMLSNIKAMNKIDGPINVYIREGDHFKLVLTSDRAILIGGRYPIRREARSSLSLNSPQSTGIYQDKDGTWISAYSPVSAKAGMVIEINYRVDSYINKLREELWIILLTCLIVLVVTAFVSYQLVNTSVSAIKRLNEIATDLEQENYDVSIDIRSKDEIGHLARTFEKLKHSIKRKIGELRLSLVREKKAHLESIIALTNAMGVKDPDTREHLNRVEEYALLIAKAMHLAQPDIDKLRYCCYLHDIGKLGIDAEILQKVKLSRDDFEQVKKHSEKGAQVLEGIDFLSDVRDVILHHQEHYDGGGYPDGLKGEEIPLLARIVAVADAFDAMTTDRPYKPKIAFKEALERERRTQANNLIRRFAGLF